MKLTALLIVLAIAFTIGSVSFFSSAAYDAGKAKGEAERVVAETRVAFLEGLTSGLVKKFINGFLPHMATSLHYTAVHKAELMKLDPDILEGMLLVDYQPEGNLMVVYTTIMDEATGKFDTVVELDRKTLKLLNQRKIPRE